MKFDNFNWERDYDKYLAYLESLSDEVYRERHRKILGVKDNLIGIRVPILREVAKNIAKSDVDSFFENSKTNFSEERLIQGFVIGQLKFNNEELKEYCELFIPKINSWAVCDAFVSSLKRINKLDKDDFFEYLIKKKNSKNFWETRFALVTFLSHYKEEKYLDTILDFCGKIKDGEYYVKMAQAWLISVLFVYHKNSVYKFLETSDLDREVINFSVQKIRDSLRVEPIDKEKVLKFKKR